MIIAICILSGLLLCSLFVIATLWMAISKIIDEYMEDNPKTFMKYYFEHQTEEKFPCTLLLTIQEGADFHGSVYDFSQYEEGMKSLINTFVNATDVVTVVKPVSIGDEKGMQETRKSRKVVYVSNCRQYRNSYYLNTRENYCCRHNDFVICIHVRRKWSCNPYT